MLHRPHKVSSNYDSTAPVASKPRIARFLGDVPTNAMGNGKILTSTDFIA
jgi:hypothetical protein